MQLPAITLPKIELPFDIPLLWHPFVDHFMIALPIVILLLELVNSVIRKKTISGMSLFLILLTVFAAVGAYFTGLVDGSEAYPTLNDAAKEALSEHKNLGTYLMLASWVVLLFKVLSMLTDKSVIRAIYIIILIIFVAGIFQQGEDGGELVYTHGLNVEQVKVLDDELFDAQEELEEAIEELEEMKASEEGEENETTETAVETTPVETQTEGNQSEVKEEAKPLQVEGMPEEMLQPEIATH